MPLGTRIPLHSRPRPFPAAGLALAALLLAAPLMPVDAAAVEGNAVFAGPMKIQRLHADPWLDGVWLATEGGLFFKDMAGSGLLHYGLPDGLPHGNVYDVAADAGTVWIGTAMGAAVLDKGTQEMRTVRNADGSFFQARVRTVFIEGGHTWLGTEGLGLYRVDAATLVAQAVPNPVDGQPFTHHIYGIGAVGQELYVSATGYGLVRWDRASGQAWEYDYGYTYNDGNPRYGRMLVTPRWIWIGTESDGAIRVDRSDWKLYEYSSPKTVNAQIVYAPIQVGSEVWFPTNAGVSRFDPAADAWRSWGYVPYDDVGDSANDVVFYGGDVFAATARGRIARYDRGLDAWFPVAWWQPDQVMTNNLVNSCGTDGAGRLLFATGYKANYYDPATGKWAVAGQEPTDRGQPNDIAMLSTGADATHRYFTHYKGVSELEVATGEFRNYAVDGRGDQDWGPNPVFDVEVDPDVVWFGMKSADEKPLMLRDYHSTWHMGKVTRMDRETRELVHYGRAEGLSDDNVTSLLSDGGRLWVGTALGGLDVIDKATGAITHVWPDSGRAYVADIAATPDAVWLAASTRGVVRIDRATLAATAVTSVSGVIPTTVAVGDGQVWVGAHYGGIFAVDPTNLAATKYGNGLPFDYNSYCMMAHEGLLYVGTGAGVQRFSLAERRFLPQVTLPGGAIPPTAGQASVTITAPGERATADQEVVVTGMAVGPSGAVVRVRAGDGPWQTAAGGPGSWSHRLDVAAEPSGDLVVSARLEFEGQGLAQDARTLLVVREGAAATTAATSLEHDPVLVAVTGQPVRFEVGAPADAAGLQVALQLRRPGQEAFEEIPLEEGAEGRFSVTPAAFTQPGEAAYRIVASWTGGSARLPLAFSGFGDTFPVTVRAAGGSASALPSGPSVVDIRAGESSQVELIVQNVGTNAARFGLTLSGTKADWVDAPATVDIPAGESRTVRLEVAVPANAKDGKYAFDIAFAPQDQPGTASRLNLDVRVAGGDGSADGGAGAGLRGAPQPAALALVALALAAWASRRHGG